jgi:hypothetical protein
MKHGDITRSTWMVLCGDFNIDYHNKSCSNVKKLIKIFEAHNLGSNKPFVSTRIFTNKNGHTSSTCIDYMVTNLPQQDFVCNLINPNVADHLSHILSLKTSYSISETNLPRMIKKRQLYPENINEFRSRLSAINWEILYQLSLNEAFRCFANEISWCYEVACPNKLVKMRKDEKSWVTSSIVEESKNLKELFRVVHETVFDENMNNEYRHRLREHKRNVKRAKM